MTDARLDRIREMVAEGVLDDHVETLAEILAEVERLRAPSGSPMDRDELDWMRELIDSTGWATERVSAFDPLLVKLLADRDHRETVADRLKVELLGVRALLDRTLERITKAEMFIAEQGIELELAKYRAKRYRSRCPVTAEDVEAAEVTRAQAIAWLLAAGLVYRHSAPHGIGGRHVLVIAEDVESDLFVLGPGEDAPAIAAIIGQVAGYCGPSPELDILDEMAAMAEEPSP
jgi:hypothetical protein